MNQPQRLLCYKDFFRIFQLLPLKIDEKLTSYRNTIFIPEVFDA